MRLLSLLFVFFVSDAFANKNYEDKQHIPKGTVVDISVLYPSSQPTGTSPSNLGLGPAAKQFFEEARAASLKKLIANIRFSGAMTFFDEPPRVQRSELGSPLFILEQGSNSLHPSDLLIWEFRPGERSTNVFAGSRLLFRSSSMRVRKFGFVGFEIYPDRVNPGSLLLLDESGSLWLGAADTESGDGKVALRRLEGTYTALEGEAERTLFAISSEGELVEIGGSGIVARHGSIIRSVPDLHRTSAGRLEILTSEGNILEFDTLFGKLTKVRSLSMLVPGEALLEARHVDDHTWMLTQKPDGTQRVVRYSAELEQSVDLGKQGERVAIIRAEAGKLWVRQGGHVVELESPVFGPRLSLRFLEQDFFTKTVRSFGVNSGLFRQVEALLPRLATQEHRVKGDLRVRQDVVRSPLAEVSEKAPKPTEKPADAKPATQPEIHQPSESKPAESSWIVSAPVDKSPQPGDPDWHGAKLETHYEPQGYNCRKMLEGPSQRRNRSY